MKVVVIGGTGLIGAKLVGLLQQAGHAVVAASPSRGIDVVSGQGLPQALAQAEVVVDVANAPSFEDQPVLDFFRNATRNLLAEAAKAGVQHYVALSVVGTERLLEGGYFRAKLVQEELIQAAGLPHTILRATQFYEFLASIAAASMVEGVARLSPAAFQPVAASDVSAALADIVNGRQALGLIELGGPERRPMVDLVQQYLAAQGDPRQVVSDPAARYFGIALNDASLVPEAGARLGPTRFADWLRSH